LKKEQAKSSTQSSDKTIERKKRERQERISKNVQEVLEHDENEGQNKSESYSRKLFFIFHN